MFEGSAALALNHAPKIKQVERPSLDFFNDLHARFAVELDSLKGLNAMTRPHEEQQRTIAEDFYHLDDPRDVMEVNRTAMNIWLYDLVTDDQTPDQLQKSYEAFTDSQKSKGKLTFEDFLELKNIVDTTIPPEMTEVFRAMLIYSDLGKSTRMQNYARQHFNREYSDHDKLLLDILEDEAATWHCLPSFSTFSENEQAIMKACFQSGFHLGQYQKLETLPYHLMGIQQLPPQLQDITMLTGLFDIAGATGDKVQNGTPALNHATFTAFKQARESVHAFHSPDLSPKERALRSYDSYLHERNQEYGFDLSEPKGKALARFVSMLRVLTPEEIRNVESAFTEHVGPTTKAIFTDLLTMTGFEDNAMWLEYGPALGRNIIKAMKESGCSFEQAFSSSVATIARVANAARGTLRKAQSDSEPATIMVAPIAHEAQKHWPRLMQHRITIQHTQSSEYTANLKPVPEVPITEQNYLPHLDHLKNDTGTTLVIGVGGGSDSLFARYTAKSLLNMPNAPVVAFPGFKESDIKNATKVAPHVYLATPETQFEGKRSFEHVSAQSGPCYVIVNVEKGDSTSLQQAFTSIAEHIQHATSQPVTQIVTVDSGGDLYEKPSDSWNRDIESLNAAQALEETLSITQSHSIILVPKEPDNLAKIAELTDTKVHPLSPQNLAAFKALCERNGLPTDDTRLYSQMLSLAHHALKADRQHTSVEPLHLPIKQALQNGRPAYGVAARSMQNALVVKNNDLRAYHSS